VARPRPPAGPPDPSNPLTRFLAPRTYLAELDGTPFLEDALKGATATRKSTVLGILRNDKDGN
jgi:hypothetical protein